MNMYLKALFFLAIFSILHFGYDFTHWDFLVPLCGIDESVFQHLKMAFWAYLLASLIEYPIMRRKSIRRKNFWYSRLLSTIMIPWLVTLIWYLIPALCGKVESLGLEVFWSVLVTILSGIIGGMMEKNIEGKDFNSSFKIVILILFIVSAFLYIWFTYKPPWIDLFINLELL
ncbi:MAG: DUF6512 family protein [candidate division WOR-3 bacterium]|nr:DUF6512 family protein [candidate division WOR-3 bacterium]